MPPSPPAGRVARVVVSLFLVLASACATAGGPTIQRLADKINATLVIGETVITPGDLLDVHFAHSVAFDQEVLVQPDGTASFLLVGSRQVAGMIPDELTRQLKSTYTGLVDNAQELTVAIKTPAIRNVSVLGEVKTPGAVSIGVDGRLTLIEAIARAGGFVKESAYLASTVLVRWDAKEQRQIAWTIDARPENWISPKTIFLQQNDLVFIPNTPIDDVGIWVENHITRTIPLPIILPLVF
jgi:polysaccharide export outer membrane protein